MSGSMLIGAQLDHNARRFPNKAALHCGEATITYAVLAERANRLANLLASAGVARGDRVVLLGHGCIDWVIAFEGIVKLGAIAVPINTRLTPEEADAMLADCGSRVVFATPDYARLFASVLVGRDVHLLDAPDAPLETRLAAHSPDLAPIEILPDDVTLILYTGGTTGVAKGVMLSHANLFWNNLNEIIDTEMTERDNTLLATPLHHSAALNCWLLPHLQLGATATILPKYSPEAVFDAIERRRATNGFSPPAMAREIVAHPGAVGRDLSSFRRWYIGGGNLPRKDRDAIHALFPGLRIFYQYGLTEAGPIVTVLKEEDYEKAPESIGRAFCNCEVAILREDLSFADVGEVGEIAMRGPQRMLGYHGRPEATAAVLHGEWLRTGDMGRMDENGFVFFQDRLKDMVKTGGLNVYSQKVELTLIQHPAINEVAVVGVASEKWGEEVVAAVVLRDEHVCDEATIIAFAKERLAGYEVPKRVIFVARDDMPINYSGKIVKRDLRQLIDRLIMEAGR